MLKKSGIRICIILLFIIILGIFFISEVEAPTTSGYQVILITNLQTCPYCVQLENDPAFTQYGGFFNYLKTQFSDRATVTSTTSSQYYSGGIPALVVVKDGQVLLTLVGKDQVRNSYTQINQILGGPQPSPTPVSNCEELRKLLYPNNVITLCGEWTYQGRIYQCGTCNQCYRCVDSNGVQTNKLGFCVKTTNPAFGTCTNPADGTNLQPVNVDSSSPALNDAKNANVKITIREATSNAYTSGTIVSVNNGRALIETCGHSLRDAKSPYQIFVDLSSTTQTENIVGTLVGFDKNRDIGLISIPYSGGANIAQIAPPNFVLKVGMTVISAGCDSGNPCTERVHTIVALDRFVPPPHNIEVSGSSVQGRSGGGLFILGNDGKLYLIGNLMYTTQDGTSVYASLVEIQGYLDSLGMSDVYKCKTTSGPTGNPGTVTKDCKLSSSSSSKDGCCNAGTCKTCPGDTNPSPTPTPSSTPANVEYTCNDMKNIIRNAQTKFPNKNAEDICKTWQWTNKGTSYSAQCPDCPQGKKCVKFDDGINKGSGGFCETTDHNPKIKKQCKGNKVLTSQVICENGVCKWKTTEEDCEAKGMKCKEIKNDNGDIIDAKCVVKDTGLRISYEMKCTSETSMTLYIVVIDSITNTEKFRNPMYSFDCKSGDVCKEFTISGAKVARCVKGINDDGWEPASPTPSETPSYSPHWGSPTPSPSVTITPSPHFPSPTPSVTPTTSPTLFPITRPTRN